MGKVSDAAMALIILIVGIYFLTKMGITWSTFWNDLMKFIYGTIVLPSSVVKIKRKRMRKIEYLALEKWRSTLERIRRRITH